AGAANGVAAAESTVGHLEAELRQSLRDAGKDGEKAAAERAELETQLLALTEARLSCEAAEKAVAELDARMADFGARRASVDAEVAVVHDESVRLRAKLENIAAQGSR